MLTEKEAQELIRALKYFHRKMQNYILPDPGKRDQLDLISDDGKNEFKVDLNQGKIEPKFTFQLRLNHANLILVRVDVGGPTHENPDHKKVQGPHIHIYKQYKSREDRWAYPLPKNLFVLSDDYVLTFINFLEFVHVNKSGINIDSR
ncbi:DUF6978 family protein [Sporolactobacillus sp. KGMB 08714]|uniref:DUF6978 family protein n=1 Tax=Sporolactobacillus sp. KGMB 08714 TaxID=3064704 RepID=UPI002FBD313F